MKVLDNSIKYTGEDFPALGVRNGMSLDIVISRMLTEIFRVNGQKIDLSAIGKEEVSVGDSIAEILKSFSDISSNNIKYSGTSFNSGLSSQSIPLLNKSLLWETSISGDNIIYSFDLNSVYNSIPSGYNLQDPRTRVSGLLVNGNTIIRENSSKTGTIQIPFDRLPANAETEIRVLTTQGDIVLTANTNISTASKASGQTIFEIKDYSASKSKEQNLSTWGDGVTSKLIEMSSFIDALKAHSMPSTDNLKEQIGIIPTISTIYTDLDKEITEVGNLNKVSVGKEKVSIQDAVNTLLFTQEKLLKEINTLKQGLVTPPVVAPVEGCINCEPTPEVVSLYGTVAAVTANTFTNIILSGVSMIMFYDSECSDCDLMNPILTRLAVEYVEDAIIGKVDIETNETIGAQYNIISTPSFVIFKDGTFKEKIVGSLTFDQLKAKIDIYL